MMNYIAVPIRFFRSYLDKGHSRSINILKNIFASFFIRGCSIAISLFLVPLTIRYVNPTQYGIWLTLSSIIGWFGFFDIGFGNGLRNKFTEALAKGERELARVYVSTTYAILSIIIGVVLLLFCLINPLLNWVKILNAPSHMGRELSILALIVFVFFCLQFILQLVTTIITANQQPAKASFFNLLGSVFSLIVIFTLTKTTSGNLLYLGLALGCTPVVVLTASSLWFYTHEYRQYAPSLKHINFAYARNLMGLGIKFFVIQIAFVILYETSNIIITQLFGPAQVTPYNIAYKYFSVVPMVFSIVLTPFWSAFTEAYVKKDEQWIHNTIRKLMKFWLLFLAGALLMLALSNKVYQLWVGSMVQVPFLLSACIFLYVMINAWCMIFSMFLNGVGKLKLQLYSSLFGSLVNIPLAIFLAKQIGIAGVVLSTCILGLISAVWSPIQYRKIMNNTASGIWNK
jgi:O-antigen/teichoic acid export membrane protein